MPSTQFAAPAVLGNAMDAMEIGATRTSKFHLDLTAAKDCPGLILTLNQMQLTELHIKITEFNHDDPWELSQLYDRSKHVRLGVLPLTRLSITYQAENTDATNNSARFMIISNLLNQLNWDICQKTDLDLQINYAEADPKLKLLEDLPMNVSLSGLVGDAQTTSDEDCLKLKLLERTYLYLDGYL